MTHRNDKLIKLNNICCFNDEDPPLGTFLTNLK